MTARQTGQGVASAGIAPVQQVRQRHADEGAQAHAARLAQCVLPVHHQTSRCRQSGGGRAGDRTKRNARGLGGRLFNSGNLKGQPAMNGRSVVVAARCHKVIFHAGHTAPRSARRRIKAALVDLYCRGWVPAFVVRLVFRLLNLRAE